MSIPKQPVKTIVKDHSVLLASGGNGYWQHKYKLNYLIQLWSDTQVAVEKDGMKIVGEPYIHDGRLYYITEMENKNYDKEMLEFKQAALKDLEDQISLVKKELDVLEKEHEKWSKVG